MKTLQYHEHLVAESWTERLNQHRLTMTDNIVRLNNYLQATSNRKPSPLRWQITHIGPQYNPLWTAVAYIDSIERGRGNGNTKSAAMNMAAEKVLQTGLLANSSLPNRSKRGNVRIHGQSSTSTWPLHRDSTIDP
ncbi:hypothetical protein BV22DRAFT_47398 [Leucogyrophana mollusca]|uniref:Uncharacterized protein n=1 Tax=Leucogyrophana mollusca TaxID=85980 RepID=A0ACB8C154_9AGAM|nr:hypothetical protein BV22DRAFT_47398 [Leucogyrophana mollusca]